MTKKLLITGASGFVGYHLVQEAKLLGFEVHAAVRKSSRIDDIRAFVDKFVFPEFNEKSSWMELFDQENYDYVIHAAAMTKAKRQEDLRKANVDISLTLLDAAFASEHSPKRIVFVSSLAAIGPIPYESPVLIREENPYRPVTAYGRSKRDTEMLIKERFSKFPVSIFRPTAVYGPGEKDLFILFKTLNGGLDAYIGRKPQKLSFIYVKDLVRLLIRSLEIEQSDLRIFNVTDGRTYERYELADLFRAVTNKKLFRIHVPFGLARRIASFSQWLYKSSTKTPVIYPERLNELTAENWGCDITKIKHELYFQPEYDLEKGMAETLEWYREHNWLK